MSREFQNISSSFQNILDLSIQLETERLDRELSILMEDEYVVDDELRQKLEQVTYQFPDVAEIHTDRQVLSRNQDWFSAKVHIKRTPLYFHRHEFMEILYMYKGQCKQYIENLKNFITLHEGDFFFLNQNVVHALFQEDEEAILIKIILPASYVSHEFIKIFDPQSEWYSFFVNALSEKREWYHYIHIHNTGEVERRFVESLMTEFYGEQNNYQQAIKNYLQLLLIQISRGQREIERCKYKLAHSSLQISNVVRYMYDHSDTVTLENLANKLAFNQSYLSRMIKENCKMNFRDLLKEIRIEKAITLLTTSTFTVETISNVVGYGNAVPVYREIKKRFGLSPIEYRKQYSKNSIVSSTSQ